MGWTQPRQAWVPSANPGPCHDTQESRVRGSSHLQLWIKVAAGWSGKIRARIRLAFPISQPIPGEPAQLPKQRRSRPPPRPQAPAWAPNLRGIASREMVLRKGRFGICRHHRGACTRLGNGGVFHGLVLPPPSSSPIPMPPISLLCCLNANNYEHLSHVT